jgi:hypothetical protein
MNLAGVCVPGSEYLLHKFEQQVLRSRAPQETIHRWPSSPTDLRQVAYRKIEPVVEQLLNEIGTNQQNCVCVVCVQHACVSRSDNLKDLHQRYVPSSTFSGPWTGSIFHTFTEVMDRVYGRNDLLRVRVALKLFIDGFR